MVKYDTTDTLWDALFIDLKRDIAASKPASLLLFTTLNLDMEKVLHAPDVVSIGSTEALSRYLESPPANRRFDLAVAVFDAENITGDSCIHLISKLRDTDCARVYLACSVSSEITNRQHDANFRSLGLKLLRIYDMRSAGKINIYLYYYDIYDYKEVPDWLNNRLWAHPNMWDKTRW